MPNGSALLLPWKASLPPLGDLDEFGELVLRQRRGDELEIEGISHHLLTGHARAGNPAGRLRGLRNKLNEEVICALLRDFREHGQKAIAKVRREQPGVYLRCLTLLVPREHKVEHSNAIKDMTDEQIERSIEIIKEIRRGHHWRA